MRGLLSKNGNLHTARVRARDEDRWLSVDMDGQHYMFDGVELSEDQEWCLNWRLVWQLDLIWELAI